MNKTPKLRFKGFSEDWEIKVLDDLAEIIMGQSPIGESYNSDGNGIGLINGPVEFTDKYPVVVQYTTKPTKYCYNDDILFCVRGSSIGRMNISNDTYCIGRGVASIRAKEGKSVTNYIYLLLQSKLEEILGFANGSTFPNISSTELKKINIKVPKLEEQEKISSFFSLIDDKISLQSEKVDMLKDYKKGMMQKIFSRELRFKDDEGRDYPEWEEKKIKDIFTVTRGVVIAKTDISESKDEINKYPVYSSQTSNYGILGYDSSYDFEGDYLTWTTDGANAGKVFRRNGKFRCTNVCGVLVENDDTIGFANKTICEILNKETPKHVSYVGNPKLMNGVMGDIKIKIPTLNEQIKIAKILDIIDKKIEKEQEKLDSLNEYKKGLLQQMFV